METTPGFFARLALAFATFFKVLFDSHFAARLLAPAIEPAPATPLPPATPARPSDESSALRLLAILQREGRFVDFLQEDISSFADADVGAAARLVHDGCRQALADYVALEPLRTEGEGASVRVERGFDPSAIRLTGNVTGEPPFSGTLKHHGWRARELKLPAAAGVDPKIVAPAEVEL